MLRPVDQQYQIMIWTYDYNASDSQRLDRAHIFWQPSASYFKKYPLVKISG